MEGDVLFFVHGFHTDLASALNSICELEKKYINPNSPIKQIVSFTSPARNKILRYRGDVKLVEAAHLINVREVIHIGGMLKNRSIDNC